MMNVGAKLKIDAGLVAKLGTGKSCGAAVHDDGSKNRINEDAVLETASYDISLGVLQALGMWIRKKFRNRGKTAADLDAEKEAARINNTCGALEEMLLEYIRAAQDGMIDEEALDELIETLDEAHGYRRAGKLAIPDRETLAGIQRSVAGFTAAMTEGNSAPSVPETGGAGEDEYSRIRAQLAAQREWIRKAR